MRFDDQVAVVTGAGGGLGRAYARLLAARGARVVVNDLGTAPSGEGSSAHRAQAVVDEIVADGGVAVADTNSVATPEGGRAIVATALEAFGRLDVLVNNAGIVRYGGFQRLAPDDVRAVLAVHLRGAFWVTRPAWEAMRSRRYGRVVLTSSSIGLLGTPGQAAYASAKAALVGLTRALAVEGADAGIRVNAVAPMATTRLNTDVMDAMFGTAAARLTPELVAPVVGYLAHRDCALNGEVLTAVGGRVGAFVLGQGPGAEGLTTPEDVAASIAAVRASAPARYPAAWS